MISTAIRESRADGQRTIFIQLLCEMSWLIS